ncbi:MAG: hypothetical protein MUF48_11190 [Pirellulaceae bacterium]|jgi:hypothetical protein|nr:hypothetical protein [Pirellulaceae bacterium]
MHLHRSLGIALVLCATWGATLGAQPPPVITHLFPAGASRGRALEATVYGRDLQDATGLRVTGTGVTTSILEVVNPNTVRVSVAVAAGAEAGERELRLLTPGGISNRLRFHIGSLPEISETEPNTEQAQAQPVSAWPVLINGQILDNDRDCYRFTAKAGQMMVCDVQARSLLPYLPDTVPGFLDACLTLYDASGKVLVSVDRFRQDPDPVLMYAIPADGQYTLEISDVLYRGRSDFVYRLAIAQGPYVTDVFPLGGQQGTTIPLELHGVGLAAPALQFSIPPGCAMLPVGPLPDALATNRLPFDGGVEAVVLETEPNDDLAHATRIQAPVAAEGRIERPSDTDHFLVAAEANQVLVLDVRARRFRSPLDSFLTVMDAQGNVLAENDDFVDPDFPLVLHHADSRLAFTFPAAGEYVLRVRDTQGRGGEAFAYRLVVAPPRPDYVLRVIPDAQRVVAGDTIVITVTAERRDGFGGDIALSVQNLPAGYSASTAVIPAGQTQAKLTITVPPDTLPGAFAPAIVGTFALGDQVLTRTAVGAEDIMQAFSFRHVVPTQELVVAVLAPSLFSLTTHPAPHEPVRIKPGAQAQVILRALRREAERHPIQLAVLDAPLGLTVQPTALAAEQDEAAITLTAPAEAPVGARAYVLIQGTMSTGQQTATRIAPAIAVEIVPVE